jgi:enoyl-CoA hydratase/carnithine racemase
VINLSRHDDAYLLHLGDDENRFSPAWLGAVHSALDEVVRDPAPVVTTASGKFYSNGLDLEWLMSHGDQVASYTADVQELLARVLTLPVATVAAVSGHAFGAGAMLALAHDWRVMRADRGFLCLPEVDIRLPFTPGMAALIQAKLTPRAAVDCMTTGTRFAGPDALASGLVDGIAGESELVDAAVARVAGLRGKDTGTLAAIKGTMFAAAVNELRSAANVAA